MDFVEYFRLRDAESIRENSEFDDAQIVHRYHHTPRIADIKREMGISTGHLYRALERHGIDPYRRQKAHRDSVIYYYEAGLSFSAIAKLTDYTVRNVRNIINAYNAHDTEEPVISA